MSSTALFRLALLAAPADATELAPLTCETGHAPHRYTLKLWGGQGGAEGVTLDGVILSNY